MNFLKKQIVAEFSISKKNRNIVFGNQGGGAQRPFGSFPKIHPFLANPGVPKLHVGFKTV